MVKVEFTWSDVKELHPEWSDDYCRDIFSQLNRELEEAMIEAAWEFLTKEVKKYPGNLSDFVEVEDPCFTEVIRAYNESTRNLNFRASGWVTPEVAIQIMKVACPGYNEFTPDTLRYFEDFEGVKIQLAREGSVCIYVRGMPIHQGSCTHMRKALGADECNWISEQDDNFADSNVIRVWWD
jgi:hypothetical protein